MTNEFRTLPGQPVFNVRSEISPDSLHTWLYIQLGNKHVAIDLDEITEKGIINALRALIHAYETDGFKEC